MEEFAAFWRKQSTAGVGNGRYLIRHRSRQLEGGKPSAGRLVVGHLCSLRCLLQPSLTTVNKQIRQETLGRFCGFNKFYIEAAILEQHGVTTAVFGRCRESEQRPQARGWVQRSVDRGEDVVFMHLDLVGGNRASELENFIPSK